MNQSAESGRWLYLVPTKSFLVGVLLGFGLCVAAGHYLSRQAMFRSYLRIFPPLQPSTFFYPTANELVAYVERTVPKDKTLVLVGGSSYFRGLGQNPGELWTHDLQRLLGDDYAVVNYAIDLSGPPAFAGVAFQILRQKYPHIVYVSTAGIFADDALDGGGVYGYIYWDAYYKNLLKYDPGWHERIRGEIAQQTRSPAGQEMHLGKRLDALTYACDLWTWIGYRHLFTVWSDSYPTHPFRPRFQYSESDDPNMAEHQRVIRTQTDYIRRTEETNLAASRRGYRQNSDGTWVLDPDTRKTIARNYDGMLPRAVRGQTLLVLLDTNPYFMQTLSTSDRSHLDDLSRLAQEVFTDLGYRSVHIGADLTADDFVDGSHLMASGGRKVASAVAAKIKTIEQEPAGSEPQRSK